MSTPAWRHANRRRVLPGYPIDRPFETKEEVVAYLSHQRVTCLLCGKKFKGMSQHLVIIHEMDPDTYRERYHIPWTYSLSCEDTIQARGDATRVHMDQETLEDNLARARVAMQEAGGLHSRPRPFETTDNLGIYQEPKHPLTPGPDGELETFSARRERLRTHVGTPEFEERMRNRPKQEGVGERLRAYWKGKKQTPEHLTARMKAIHGEDWAPKTPKVQEAQEITCRECGRTFSYLGIHPPAFCDTVCRNKSLSARARAANALRTRENPMIPCDYCGAPFQPRPEQMRRIQKGLPVYCGLVCRGKANVAKRFKNVAPPT